MESPDSPAAPPAPEPPSLPPPSEPLESAEATTSNRKGGIAGRKWKDWTEKDKLRALKLLMDRVEKGGKVARGGKQEVAKILGVAPSRVSRLWKKFQDEPTQILSQPKNKQRLGMRKYPPEVLKERLKGVPKDATKSIRALGAALNIPYSTLQRYKSTDGFSQLANFTK